MLKRKDVVFKRHAQARRYIARVDSEGQIVLTLPRGGTQRDALSFANNHYEWLVDEKRKALLRRKEKGRLFAGDQIWFRGERHPLGVVRDWGRPILRFADQAVLIADAEMDLARPLGQHLRGLAKKEFPVRTQYFADRHGVKFSRVAVRDQRTRWGSCSAAGTISLNWRLIMTPPETSDYIIIHELMHTEEMNHSHRFWRLVREACPDYKRHEDWLGRHQNELAWG